MQNLNDPVLLMEQISTKFHHNYFQMSSRIDAAVKYNRHEWHKKVAHVETFSHDYTKSSIFFHVARVWRTFQNIIAYSIDEIENKKIGNIFKAHENHNKTVKLGNTYIKIN